VLNGCKPQGLAALALTSCDFIDDLTAITVTRQLPPPPSAQQVAPPAGQVTVPSPSPAVEKQPADIGVVK